MESDHIASHLPMSTEVMPANYLQIKPDTHSGIERRRGLFLLVRPFTGYSHGPLFLWRNPQEHLRLRECFAILIEVIGEQDIHASLIPLQEAEDEISRALGQTASIALGVDHVHTEAKKTLIEHFLNVHLAPLVFNDQDGPMKTITYRCQLESYADVKICGVQFKGNWLIFRFSWKEDFARSGRTTGRNKASFFQQIDQVCRSRISDF
jgi:hypothetical protein